MSSEIAKTIWTQMNKIDRNLVWCMGTCKPTAIESGLEIHVSGLSFKGIVRIVLNGSDLYDIALVKPVKRISQRHLDLGIKKYETDYVVQKTIQDIFVEDLMPVLEQEVESRQTKSAQ
jgi:hypothetical protein